LLTVWEEEPRLDGGSYDAKRTATTAAGRFNSVCVLLVTIDKSKINRVVRLLYFIHSI